MSHHADLPVRLADDGSLLALADGAPAGSARSVGLLLATLVTEDAAVMKQPAPPSALVHEAAW